MAKSYLDTLFTEPTNSFDELKAGDKMSDLGGSLINEYDLEVHWEKGDQLVLDFGPDDFFENEERKVA